jgi:hypothetical protein
VDQPGRLDCPAKKKIWRGSGRRDRGGLENRWMDENIQRVREINPPLGFEASTGIVEQ